MVSSQLVKSLVSTCFHEYDLVLVPLPIKLEIFMFYYHLIFIFTYYISLIYFLCTSFGCLMYVCSFIFDQTWIIVNVSYLGLGCNLSNPLWFSTFIVVKVWGTNIYMWYSETCLSRNHWLLLFFIVKQSLKISIV